MKNNYSELGFKELRSMPHMTPSQRCSLNIGNRSSQAREIDEVLSIPEVKLGFDHEWFGTT